MRKTPKDGRIITTSQPDDLAHYKELTMRNLTSKQRKYLDKIVATRDVQEVEELTYKEWETLKQMNDTEVLYQQVNGYLWDKAIEAAHAPFH
jgi:hypothetical protein